MDITYIYVLKCPITYEIKYVGKANKPKQRYYAHMNLNKTSSSYKKTWIKQLKDNNLKPILEIIAEVPINSWQEYEKYYINYYISLGCKLTNLGLGGEGLNFGNQTSFKKGVVNYKKERLKKECLVCGNLFEVSPSVFNKYKCCSMLCSKQYRKNNINLGKFKQNNIPWNKGTHIRTKKGKKVDQKDIITNKILNTFSSMTEAEKYLNVGRGSISKILNKNVVLGGYIWELHQ